MSVNAPVRAGDAFADRSAYRSGAEVLARQRELAGCDVLCEPDAHAWVYGFLPVQCDCPDGRCAHRPEVIRLRLRGNVPVRDPFRRGFAAIPRCDHRRNGVSVASCGYCAHDARPERAPAKRDHWHPTAAMLGTDAEPIAA